MRHALMAFPIAWMAVILWLGSDAGSTERTGTLILPLLRALFPSSSPLELETMHALVRKAGHVGEYVVLTGLWAQALAIGQGLPVRRAAWVAWVIACGVAILDEGLQSTRPSRTASPADVGLDAAAALLVAVLASAGWRRTADVLTRVALWMAAGGGVLMLLVNRMTGVESGVLWIAVPAAVVALVFLRRVRP